MMINLLLMMMIGYDSFTFWTENYTTVIISTNFALNNAVMANQDLSVNC